MNENPAPMRQGERYVTLVGPADYRDVTLLTEDGEIRLFEGRVRLPEWLAAKHLKPGWHIRFTRP
jgi:hypothetical protein